MRYAMLRRVEVQLALFIGGTAAALCSLLLCGLFAFAILESLESTGAVLEDAVTDVVAAAAGLPGGQRAGAPWLHRGIAYRVTDEDGRVLRAAGPWPAAPARAFAEVSLWAALTSAKRDYLVHREPAATDRVVEVAMPLAHFVDERAELVRAVGWIVPLGLAGALGFGMVTARRALQPVRQTGAALRTIDAGRLDVRLPTRGTGDDLDGLVTAINGVLARVQWAFERLARFSADVAHELRTPLNRVSSMVEVALMDRRGDRATEDLLETIRESVQGMQGSVEGLLLLARGEEGRVSLTREHTDLGALLSGLIDLYLPLAEEGGRRLVCRATEAHACVDRQLVTRALVNLIENALRHTDPGATIRAGLQARQGRLIVIVEDSGPGIAAADRERVFGRFVRLDPASSSAGSGLGLAIARMIARLHGGELWVEDSALGGAAFHLALAAPVVATGDAGPDEQPPRGSDPRS
jgi:signal transduction histidine kinase